MANSNILTGQFVRIAQTPASVGERLSAQLADWLVQGVFFAAMSYLVFGLGLFSWSGSVEFIVFMFLILFPSMFYALLCELLNNGQTLGKRMLRMRVVKRDGSRPGLGSYLLRWMMMLVDGPTMGGLGVLVMVINKDTQRLGDLAAGTLVIKEGSYAKLQVSLDEFNHFSRNYRPFYPAAENLSLEQVNLITQTLQLSDDDPRLHALAAKVKQTLAIDEVREPQDSSFLWRVVRDYQYYALEDC